MKVVHCHLCGTRMQNDEIALNLKLLGRQIGVTKCLPCLAEFLGCDEQELNIRMQQYKETGCLLFTRQYTL